MKRRRALRVCRSLSLSVTLARQLHARKGVGNDFLKRIRREPSLILCILMTVVYTNMVE